MDEPVIYSELKSVLVLQPGKVVDEVVHGNVPDGRAVLCLNRTEAHKVYIRSVAGADIGDALADVAITESVDQRRLDCPDIAGGDAFAVRDLRVTRRVSPVLWDAC